jgi:hypothetical protein
MSSGRNLADSLAVHCDCNNAIHRFQLSMYDCLQEQAALREQLHDLTLRLSAAEQGQRAAEDTAQQEQAQEQAAMQVSSKPCLCLLPCFGTPLFLLCDTFSCL